MLARIRKAQDDEGFTLIELLVVVIIIGILAAIAIPTFLNQRRSGWEAQAKSALRNAVTNAEAYGTSRNGSYTSMAVGDVNAGIGNSGGAVTLAAPVLSANGSNYCLAVTHSSLPGRTFTYTKYVTSPDTIVETACGTVPNA